MLTYSFHPDLLTEKVVGRVWRLTDFPKLLLVAGAELQLAYPFGQFAQAMAPSLICLVQYLWRNRLTTNLHPHIPTHSASTKRFFRV